MTKPRLVTTNNFFTTITFQFFKSSLEFSFSLFHHYRQLLHNHHFWVFPFSSLFWSEWTQFNPQVTHISVLLNLSETKFVNIFKHRHLKMLESPKHPTFLLNQCLVWSSFGSRFPTGRLVVFFLSSSALLAFTTLPTGPAGSSGEGTILVQTQIFLSFWSDNNFLNFYLILLQPIILNKYFNFWGVTIICLIYLSGLVTTNFYFFLEWQ